MKRYQRVRVSACIAILVMASVLMVSAQFASAQIVFDNATFGNATFDHTIGGGYARMLVVGVGREEGGDVSVTYDGAVMTRIAGAEVRIGSVPEQWTDLFWLGEAGLPGAGTHEVAISGDADPAFIAAGAISLRNVSQEPPEATAANGDFDSEGLLELSANITTQTDGAWVIDVLGSGFGPDSGAQVRTPTVQTLRGTVDGGSNSAVMSTLEVSTAGSTTVGYTITGDGANRIALSVAAFGPAGPNLILNVEGTTFAVEGGSITMSANETMASPFQWQLDGGDLGGETTDTLSLSSTTTADSGLYTLTFDDGGKAIISSNPVSVEIFPSGALPVAGIVGLGALVILCAAGGTIAVRRRSR